MDVFDRENIKVYTGQVGTVGQVIEQFKKSGLKASGSERSEINATTASSGICPGGGTARPQSQGMGGGGGRGMGGGGGRGMGGGGGRGMGGGCGGGGRP